MPSLAIKAAGGVSQLRLIVSCETISRMKGHEDDGNVLWNGRSTFNC
jgi:hypothetical protein